MASAQLKTFDSRLPMPEVLLHLRTIFDFRRMPWSDVNALVSHSDDSIAWLVDKKFPDLDVVVVKNEALKVRMWLKYQLDRFYIDVPIHNEHGDVIKGQS